MVRLQTLDLRIGVRVPASQPFILKDFSKMSSMFMCRFASVRQIDWVGEGSPFAEDSAPGGSRNGSTEMRS